MPVHEDISYDQCCRLVREYARKEHLEITEYNAWDTIPEHLRNPHYPRTEADERVIISINKNGMEGQVTIRRSPVSLDDYKLDFTGSYGLELLYDIEKILLGAM